MVSVVNTLSPAGINNKVLGLSVDIAQDLSAIPVLEDEYENHVNAPDQFAENQAF